MIEIAFTIISLIVYIGFFIYAVHHTSIASYLLVCTLYHDLERLPNSSGSAFTIWCCISSVLLFIAGMWKCNVFEFVGMLLIALGVVKMGCYPLLGHRVQHALHTRGVRQSIIGALILLIVSGMPWGMTVAVLLFLPLFAICIGEGTITEWSWNPIIIAVGYIVGLSIVMDLPRLYDISTIVPEDILNIHRSFIKW